MNRARVKLILRKNKKYFFLYSEIISTANKEDDENFSSIAASHKKLLRLNVLNLLQYYLLYSNMRLIKK